DDVAVSRPPAACHDSFNATWVFCDTAIVHASMGVLELFEEGDRAARQVLAVPDEPVTPQRGLKHLHVVGKFQVYVGTRDVRQSLRPDRTNALKAASTLGAKKRQAAESRARGLWDYIQIAAPPEDASAGSSGSHASPTAHHRRGHFRLQACGVG